MAGRIIDCRRGLLVEGTKLFSDCISVVQYSARLEIKQIRHENDTRWRGSEIGRRWREGVIVVFEWGDEENHIMLKDKRRQDVPRLKGV